MRDGDHFERAFTSSSVNPYRGGVGIYEDRQVEVDLPAVRTGISAPPGVQ